MACEESNVWEDFFDQADVNCDGKITMRELKIILGHYKEDITDSEIANMFRDCDKNGDGLITREEFLGEMLKTDRRTAITEAFKQWDKSGDGKLQRSEVEAALRSCAGKAKITDDDIARMVEKADVNKDGVIDLDEFMKAIY